MRKPKKSIGSSDQHEFACLCCGHLTLDEEPPGTFIICRECKWEDAYRADPAHWGVGANWVNLETARVNYRKFGICNPDLWEIYPENAPPGWKPGSKP